uniref:hypothetical protein n=1 Tax=Prevotella aurantiaca TaxID=596085 RepID=UPI00278BBB9E|nr:hypothetical protein [Prevotella aurantiaca]
MRKNLLKNTYVTIAILLVSLFAMPTTANAQMAYDLAIAVERLLRATVTTSQCLMVWQER